jgi:hypothetical protein
MKLACSMQNRRRVVNVCNHELKTPVDVGNEAVLSDSFLFDQYFRCFPVPLVRDFFRSAMNEIGNSDHQAIQAGCGA